MPATALPKTMTRTRSNEVELAVSSPSTPGQLPEIQRARMLAALVAVVREVGPGQLTVTHIVERSGVSRRTFYEVFEDREDCFLAALQEATDRATQRALAAAAGQELWREQLRAGLKALLELFDEDPGLAGLCVVDALAAGEAALTQRARIVLRLVAVVDRGRREASPGLNPSRLAAEGVVGGVLGVLHGRLAARDSRPLSSLQSQLMAMIVLPYLGPVAAAEEASRATPRARRQRSERGPSNPLEGLHMRLTYRTVRVLCAIGAKPEASNRRVADAAGVHDPGQISKLLTRLESVGLIENLGPGAHRGEPNAWRLTARGHEVQCAVVQPAAA